MERSERNANHCAGERSNSGRRTFQHRKPSPGELEGTAFVDKGALDIHNPF